jgi:hypothetical protein
MTEGMVMQGRKVTAADVELIRILQAEHPARGRTPLSQELCRRWDWRNALDALQRVFLGNPFVPTINTA